MSVKQISGKMFSDARVTACRARHGKIRMRRIFSPRLLYREEPDFDDNNKIILQTTDYKKVSAIPIGTGALIDYAVVGRIADFCFLSPPFGHKKSPYHIN